MICCTAARASVMSACTLFSARGTRGELASYLIGITADIFSQVDEETGQPVLDVILDQAGSFHRDWGEA